MKKIILSLFLLLTLTYAESPIKRDFEVGKWRGFFGVEGGVGNIDIFTAFILSANAFNDYGLLGLSYGGGILGGWQKYTYEKIGMRNTLGLRVFGAKNLKAKNASYEKYEKDLFIDTTFYYAFDGLFDFVKNGNNRFGMSLGFSTDLLQLTESKNLSGFGFFFRFSPRLGFYTQFDNHIVDFIASVPIIGAGGGELAYNSTLTLSYKYLF